MSKLFGFVQIDLPGTLAVPDGRYLADGDESVLVLRTLGAAPPQSRRRRRIRGREAPPPESLPLTRVTAIRAGDPIDGAPEAARWLDEACEAEDTVEVLLREALGLLNRALHAQALAGADPQAQGQSLERAAGARIGYGSGEETAQGRFIEAREVRTAGTGGSRRRRRHREEMHPQERLAAVLRGRERADACETMLLRARADVDAGRWREAALQLRAGLEALLVELAEALADPGHERDLAALREGQGEAERIAGLALAADLRPEQRQTVQGLLEVCERVLRRRRVLRG